MDNNNVPAFFKLISNRIFILFCLMAIGFSVLIMRAFNLQIINGQKFLETIDVRTVKKVKVDAPRGEIYDKYGRPLAINESAYTMKIDTSITNNNKNQSYYKLIKIFEMNNQEYVDELPISKEEPYTFTFNDSETRETRWRKDMNVPDKYETANETFNYLRDFFNIPKELSNNEARKLVGLNSLVYMNRYQQIIPVTIAYGVNQKTMTMVEEQKNIFPDILIDAESLRNYPEGQFFSHTIGYIGKIMDKDTDYYKDLGYSANDKVGRTGLELSFEKELNGKDGELNYYVSRTGKKLETLSEEIPVQGDKVFLTMDANLQKKTFNIFENMLKVELLNKMKQRGGTADSVSAIDTFISMVKSNNISMKKIFESKEGTSSYVVYSYIKKMDEQASIDTEEEKKKAKNILQDGILNGQVSTIDMCLILLEQGIITGDENYKNIIKTNQITTLQVIMDKLEQGELTPQTLNLDPSTGSVVVMDVNTGSVLSAVSYPTYDTNQLVNNFNNEYYHHLNFEDPTTPLNNRPFMEPRAPGSTFKMISAISGLESGTITPDTKIYDSIIFKDAGVPYIKCWSTVSHGSINVAEALEVSCNYFFASMAYNMGNSKNGNSSDSIDTIVKYATEFGLNERTGVEIGEFRDFIKQNGEPVPVVVSSPLYKAYVNRNSDNDSDRLWHDGDTSQTAIGQSSSNYTSASMAKYIGTLANRGTRYKSHIVDRVETIDNTLVTKYDPVIEKQLDIKQQTYDTVLDGMLLVTGGKSGTARSVFANFPISVAGKTGTAQEGRRPDHASFAGFAPSSSPEIAVYVLIPYGTSKSTVAPAAQVARDVIAEYFGLNDQPERIVAKNTLMK